MVVSTLRTAIEARNQLIQDVYQITGISDILRGQSDPNETLGAQELKAQNGSRRVKNAKDEMARFAKDIGHLVAEVIAEVFQPQTIADMTGFKYRPEPIQGGALDPMGQALLPPPSVMGKPSEPPMATPPPQMPLQSPEIGAGAQFA